MVPTKSSHQAYQISLELGNKISPEEFGGLASQKANPHNMGLTGQLFVCLWKSHWNTEFPVFKWNGQVKSLLAGLWNKPGIERQAQTIKMDTWAS